ncbi:hypothetical protein V5O48_017412 [Marasmius crinis-equi]|uniref:Uncharacterized protein n=1 Tax=Marasmius crinis-equi TaxID=585013 RepID=A0ABR3EP26_9AGAR
MAQESEHQGQLRGSQIFDVGRWEPSAQESTEIDGTASHSETAPFVGRLPQCKVCKWYSDLHRTNPISTKIDKLQVRRTNPHLNKVTRRFVVLYMSDGTVHRLDRRAGDPNDHNLISGLSFTTRGRVATTDELTSNVDTEELKKGTYLEIEIALEGKVDLWVVLSTCHAISKDPDGQTYDLREHNYFFFSWSILMVASRYYLHIRTPTRAELIDQLEKEHLSVLTKLIVGKAVDTFRNLVLAAVSIFQEKEQESSKEGEDIRKGMSYLARVVLGLPEGVLGFSGGKAFDAILPADLRKTLEVHIETVVRDRALMIYDQVLRSIDMHLELPGRPLWVGDLEEVIRSQVQKAVADMLWRAVIDAIMQGFGLNVEAPCKLAEVSVNVAQSYWEYVGTRTVQIWAVQIAALQVSGSKEDRAEELRRLNEKMFDLAWSSAQEGALKFSKEAARRAAPSSRLKYQEVGDVTWNTVWKVWDGYWDKARAGVREKALDTLDAIVIEILDASATTVLEELCSGKMQPTVHVRTPENLLKLQDLTLSKVVRSQFFMDSANLLFTTLVEQSGSGWKGPMTSFQLQRHMQRLMQRTQFARPDDVQVIMTRIWVRVRGLGIEFQKLLTGEE